MLIPIPEPFRESAHFPVETGMVASYAGDRLLSFDLAAVGTVGEVYWGPDDIRRVVHSDADRIVVAHNHPGERDENLLQSVSYADVFWTLNMLREFASGDQPYVLADHLVIGTTQAVSLRASDERMWDSFAQAELPPDLYLLTALFHSRPA